MKIFYLIFGIAIFSLIAFVGCEKDEEEANKFLGSYNYYFTLNNSGDLKFMSGEITITKTASNKIDMLQSDSSKPAHYTVGGSVLVEDNGQTLNILIDNKFVTFTENSSGILQNNIIKINKFYVAVGYNTMTYELVLTKK